MMEDDFYSRGLRLPKGQQKHFWSGREGKSKDKIEIASEKEKKKKLSLKLSLQTKIIKHRKTNTEI